MIIFQTDEAKVNLTNKGIRFNEESDYFSNRTSKSYSFPFVVKLDEEISVLLGLINVPSVNSYKPKIYGTLIIDRMFYEAYISIGEVTKDTAEITLYYGKEVLPVFDKKLNELPFGPVQMTGYLPAHAKDLLTKSWPEATHNFPKMFREDIKQKSNYKHFEYFINNYQDVSGTWMFPNNQQEIIDGETVSANRNVMAPFPYLLEIFKVAFASEGLQAKGAFMNDEFYKKVLLVPQTYFEQFAVTEFENYSFSYYTSQEDLDGRTINVYTKQHAPSSSGSYVLKFRINFSNALAQYFNLKITQGGETLYEATSENTQVNIDETLRISSSSGGGDPIIVTLKLSQVSASIETFNTFTYLYKEGDLNVFPGAYSLADFMPDMTFREFINKIKSWLNLKFEYTDNAVYIDYLDDYINTVVFEDKSHLQDPYRSRIINQNNLFKMTYPNGTKVLVNKHGQTYSDKDYIDSEIEELEIEALPLEVYDNKGIVTAVYPEEEEDLMFCIYNGLVNNDNLAIDNINGEKLTIQEVYNTRWTNWLRFRANSEVIKDRFFLHITETYTLKTGIFKYNKKQLVKSISKKRVDNEHWQVEVESETL